LTILRINAMLPNQVLWIFSRTPFFGECLEEALKPDPIFEGAKEAKTVLEEIETAAVSSIDR
jgi:hypothetical protein